MVNLRARYHGPWLNVGRRRRHRASLRVICHLAVLDSFDRLEHTTNMNQRGRTIQIFLPSGDPRGMRLAELTTSIVRVFEVPRAQLSDFLAMPEARQVGVYFLVGDDESSGVQAVYVGQSGGVGDRLETQHKTRDWWSRALVAVSLTNSFTQTHSLYLEWMGIKRANETGRYLVQNGNAGSRPHTPRPLEADCDDIFDTLRTLLGTLGYPFLEPLAKAPEATSRDELFYCTAAGSDAVGEYTAEGFVVLKSSKGRATATESFQKTAAYKTWLELETNGVVAVVGDARVFQRDYLLGSPSQAARFVVANSINGWTAWRTTDGRTLDEVKRQ